jgi:hypothetical protein
MMTICKGCGKTVNEEDTSFCIHCSAAWCCVCEKNGVAAATNCACQQVLNEIWDAEEAIAADVARLAVN